MEESSEIVYIITNVLQKFHLNILRKECDGLVSDLSHDTISHRSCAIDLFENASLHEEHNARINSEEYFKYRWKNNVLLNDHEKNVIKDIMIELLPSLLSTVTGTEESYLFNEHYIVKPPFSRDTFRWHRDSDEQLQSCYELNDKVNMYHSFWCPLDDTSLSNGTLQVPANTTMKYYALSTNQHTNNSMTLREIHDNEVINEFTTMVNDCDVEDVADTNIDDMHDDDDGDVSSNHSNNIITIKGKALNINAGSIVIFSSKLLHSSGINSTDSYRNVLYAQYSSQIISTSTTTNQNSNNSSNRLNHISPLCFAIPCRLHKIHIDCYNNNTKDIKDVILTYGNMDGDTDGISKYKKRKFIDDDT